MAPITFRAKLEAAMEGKGWTFATMPKTASAKLGKKGRVPITGTINGFPFRTSAFPDGEGSHLFNVNADMRKGAGLDQGETAEFVIEVATDEVKVAVPADLKRALAAHPGAKAQWDAITPKAREAWVQWIEGAKQAATREGRIEKTCERLAAGAKRPSD
ncbi:MAG TPA: YdeI/OmpD-associated family protein [Candidatus Thermoplasmatota archaeon]|nr:YdeI/OmpD-associated family protein [Candidatus Thermoplasmatota archaeon]